MKKYLLLLMVISLINCLHAQLSVRYNPAIQPTGNMQYFKPVGTNLFVGDCIPFYRNGTYYLYWLIDSAHHSALNGLGGHQWVLSTTKDLQHWTHYPIAIGIDEAWEKSICTGSVVYSDKKFYAFYATRLINSEGKVNEQLSYAVSDDAIHFTKQKPNPFYTSAPGYSSRDFRDPKVSVDSQGTFHLFVSSKKNNPAIKDLDGALVHITSTDLKHWEVKDPLITGQGSVPECPDYFNWNGWYYIVYGDNGNTFYMKSRNAYGPWQQPAYQTLNEDWVNVVKTAEFTGNRRIAAGWIPSRKDNKDDTYEIFGGSAVFREVVQQEDGTLDTKFAAEMIPATGNPLALKRVYDSAVTTAGAGFVINSPNGVGTAHFEHLPLNCRITLDVEPSGLNEEFGCYLRAGSNAENGYKLGFSANNETVSLANTNISGVKGLGKKLKLDIIIKNDIIDVCIDNRRCIVNRLPEQKGGSFYLYAKHGKVQFTNLTIAPIIEH